MAAYTERAEVVELGEGARRSIQLELCKIRMYSTRSLKSAPLESVQFVRNEHIRIAV